LECRSEGKAKRFQAKVITERLMKNLEVKTLAKRLKKAISQIERDENALKSPLHFDR
jgi:Trp operon repressor